MSRINISANASGTGTLTVTSPNTNSDYTLTLPANNITFAGTDVAQTWTAAQTFRAANAVRSEAASTQDAIVIAGRGGGTSSYAVTLTPTTLSANRTLTLPDGTGTAVVNGVNGSIVSGTALAYNWNGLTTNTVLDFTGIPSWVKRITVMFQGVSTNGASNYLVQIGSTTFSTSGYACGFTYISSGVATASATSGFAIANPTGTAVVFSGIMTLALVSSNTWVSSHTIGETDTARTMLGGGVSPNLAAALDRVRITTVNGTDTFDAGTVNILYE